MANEVHIKRYNAYYHGWFLAFGEHEANRDETRELYWLTGENRFGMAVSPQLRRHLNQALLGQRDKIPELILGKDRIQAENKNLYTLTDEIDEKGMREFKEFLGGKEQLHLFMTNHFCYPAGTHILTFATEKPTILLYKEMQPLKVLID